MNKLYTKQSILLRKEVEMAQSISDAAEVEKKSDDYFRFSSKIVDGPIPEIESKFISLITTLDDKYDANKFKMVSSIVNFETNDYIRPNYYNEYEPTCSYLIFTLISKSDDIKRGQFIIYSEDGYQSSVDLERYESIVIASGSKYEISRLLNGSTSFLITHVHTK